MTVFILIALPNQNKVDPWRAKKASSIQHGCIKSGTHARIFPKHLGMGRASTTEDKETEGKQKIVKMERSSAGTK